ncbi:unnamed protein product [Blepharisma stoltei]|uniref:Uncharacterized protein n=1 Tax=Blepharisma stoltei TaxID=1481888 RepID=A0AAU9J6N8_9CILI|nr:unnamed protein product [Blepharisma stoltei]
MLSFSYNFSFLRQINGICRTIIILLIMEESVPLEEEKHDIRIFSLPIDSNNIGKNVDMENIFSNTEPPSPMTDASVPNFVSNHKPSEINRKPKYNLKNLKGILKKKLVKII